MFLRPTLNAFKTLATRPSTCFFHTHHFATMSSAEQQHQKDITSWASKDGSFNRLPSKFTGTRIQDGGEFPAEKDRYHLIVSLACPWAHRTLIVRKLKGLDFIPVSVVHPFMGAKGWSFYPPIRDGDGGYPATEGEVATEDDGVPDVTRENPLSAKFVREYYFKVNPQYEGRFTVPILWDTKQNKIVNNESSEIIRIFNTDFNNILPDEFAKVDLFPQSLQKEIEDQNEWVYNTVNNGVYKSGFSTSQQAYEAAVKPLFESLDRLEKILDGGKKHLIGDQLTEADVRLYTTIIRFDIVYVGHFKCNLGTIRHNYPNLNNWLKNLYWNEPAFMDTTSVEHCKRHYYMSHGHINPTRVVPFGPIPAVEEL